METEQVIVVVDPYSTGRVLLEEFQDKDGFDVKVVLSDPEFRAAKQFLSRDDSALLHHGCAKETLVNLLQACGEKKIVGVLPGAETGVQLADELSNLLETRRNPLETSKARRNKYLMAETIKQRSGGAVRVVQQALCTEWDQVVDFINEWNPAPFQVIVKPIESAGGDKVYLCKDLDEIRSAFEEVNGSMNQIGMLNNGVLVQEYLQGPEYVVDTVSMDGKHKVAALWEYDKRHANDQFNVYFGMRAHGVEDDPRHLEIVEYVFKVLDMLQIHNGPGHAEVKWTSTGPCLVEVGSRCHGGAGAWKPIALASFGCDQISLTASIFTNAAEFHKIETFPKKLLRHTRNIDLVAYQSGILERVCMDVVSELASFSSIELGVKEGERLIKTCDVFSSPGQIQLIHEDPQVLDAEYELVHELVRLGKFFHIAQDKSALAEKAEDLPQED